MIYKKAYMRQQGRLSLVQTMVCRLFGAKPLSELMLDYCKLDLANIFQWNVNLNTTILIDKNAFEDVVRKMAAILSRPQCVNDISRYSFGLGETLYLVVWAKRCISIKLLIRSNLYQQCFPMHYTIFTDIFKTCSVANKWNIIIITGPCITPFFEMLLSENPKSDILQRPRYLWIQLMSIWLATFPNNLRLCRLWQLDKSNRRHSLSEPIDPYSIGRQTYPGQCTAISALGLYSLRKDRLIGIGVPIIKIRRPPDNGMFIYIRRCFF